MACDPNQLLEDAKCIMWCIPRGYNAAIEVSLLCHIMQGGGVVGDCILTESGLDIDIESAAMCLMVEA